MLSLLAILLLVAFDAQVTRLIQLYVVGVFTSFTLSQTSMVRRWLRTREPGWRRSIAVNAVGGLTTGVVLVVVAFVKFLSGAWIVITAIPLFVWLMSSIRQHYRAVAEQLRVRGLVLPAVGRHRVVVLVAHTGQATRRAIRFAELMQPDEIEMLHVKEPGDDDLLDTWDLLYPGYPLTVLEREAGLVRTIRRQLRQERGDHPVGFMTVIVSELVTRRHWTQVLRRHHGLIIKASLLFEPGLVVTDITHQPRRYRAKHSIPEQEVESAGGGRDGG